MAITLNTNTVKNALEIINTKAARKTARTLTPEQEQGRENTITALRTKALAGVRMTYARFAEVARENGWIGESKISDGQYGSGLIGKVPEDLQAFVCRSNGTYHKKAKENFYDSLPEIEGKTPEEVLNILRYLPAEGPGGEMRDFTPKSCKAE